MKRLFYEAQCDSTSCYCTAVCVSSFNKTFSFWTHQSDKVIAYKNVHLIYFSGACKNRQNIFSWKTRTEQHPIQQKNMCIYFFYRQCTLQFD